MQLRATTYKMRDGEELMQEVRFVPVQVLRV